MDKIKKRREAGELKKQHERRFTCSINPGKIFIFVASYASCVDDKSEMIKIKV